MSDPKQAEHKTELAKSSGDGKNESGFLIAFESCNGAGRTGIVQHIKKELEDGYDRKVHVVSFPDYGAVTGPLLKDVHSQSKLPIPVEALFLLQVANIFEHVASIKEELLNGKIVLCDGYVYSCLAYSLALSNKTLDSTISNWYLDCVEKLPEPHLVIFLDNGSQKSDKSLTFFPSPHSKVELHGGSGDEDNLNLDVEIKAYKNFSAMEELNQGMWCSINCNDLISEIAETVLIEIFQLNV